MGSRTDAAAATENMSSRIGNGAVVVAGLWNRGVVPVNACTGERDTEEGNLEVEISNIAVHADQSTEGCRT